MNIKTKTKKVVILILILIFTMILLFTACQPNNRREKEKELSHEMEEEFISRRIENYTSDYFEKSEDIEVITKVMIEEDEVAVYVAFVPVVGSFIVKEELYENITEHAYQINKFFPEVSHFDYVVLWDDYSKEEALYLTIDKEAVYRLEGTYTSQLINKNGGLDTNFSEIFSEIVETEESKTWQVRVDPNAELP